jgi:potassium channel subfamily K
MIMLGFLAYHISKIVLQEGKSAMEEQIKHHKRRKAYEESTSGCNDELEIREKQFKRMREIEHKARRNCQLISVGISTVVWLFLSLGGAFFFRLTERDQNWSYFESLYFTQMALLTIGYGDLCPLSNAGRSLFVLWSVLAVPTTTMLVTSTIDYLHELLKYEKLEKTFYRALERLLHADNGQELKESRGLGHGSRKDREQTEEKSPGGKVNHSSHDRTHIAAVLLEKAINDHIMGKEAQYEFVDWEWFLYSLGAIDEAPGEHPTNVHKIPNTWAPHKPWNWLHEDTALASRDSEAEWILDKLVGKLVHELGKIRKEYSLRQDP